MSFSLLLITLIYLSITPINGTINKKFVGNQATKSVFCNICGIMAFNLNKTLYDQNTMFETNVGYRLDSNGKKIRKNSQWLQLHLAIDDISCNWKDSFKIAKRHSGLLYLISKLYIEKNSEINDKHKLIQKENKKQFYITKKPKMYGSSKMYKLLDDMCHELAELFDEWLHSQSAKYKKLKTNDNENDIKKYLNMTQFCLNDLIYKKNKICTDDMLNNSIDLYTYKRKIKYDDEDDDQDLNLGNNIKSSTKLFIMDLILCYMVILLVLALFCYTNTPIIVCKCAILILFVCPYWIYSRNPSFGNLSTWCFICCWYALRYWHIFNNEQFFGNKSYFFCWVYAGLMKNMYRATIQSSIININAFIVQIVSILFMIKVHPFVFNVLLSKIEITDICEMSIYPNILIKIAEILSFTIVILYCLDYAGVLLLNLTGYSIDCDMNEPWKSYSVSEFWSKRWNQSVARELRLCIYKPIIKATNSRILSIIYVFLTLGIVHIIPMWLDGFERNILIIVFIWFSSQPLVLLIEEKIIIPVKFGSSADLCIHCGVTFILLFGSFLFSLQSTCYAMKTYKL